MAKFNVRAWRVKTPLDFSKITDEAMFKPCADGNEFSIGLMLTFDGKKVWTHRGRQVVEFRIEERRVPKKWLDAEYARRVKPEMKAEERVQLGDQVKAELWAKVMPTYKFGWAAYMPDLEMLIVQSSVRHAEEVTHMLRMALGSLPIDCAYSPRGFEAMVRDMISTDDFEDPELSLGKRVDMYEGSGRSKRTVTFRNFENISSNHHIADHLRYCSGVGAAAFNLDSIEGMDDDSDDITASPYGELVISEVKDKEADEYGTIMTRLDTAITVVDTLTRVSDGYAPDNWKTV